MSDEQRKGVEIEEQRLETTDGRETAEEVGGENRGGSGEQGEENGGLDLDDDELGALLGRALRVEEEKAPDLLPGVQERIRVRSKGKFFRDGWGTGLGPRSTYFVTSVLMLLVLIGMYLALRPWW